MWTEMHLYIHNTDIYTCTYTHTHTDRHAVETYVKTYTEIQTGSRTTAPQVSAITAGERPGGARPAKELPRCCAAAAPCATLGHGECEV